MTEYKLNSKQINSIQKVVRHFPNNTQFSVGLIKDGTISTCGVLKTQLGIALVDNSDAVFEIGSISKVFTATMLAKLVHEGSIELFSKVKEYLPYESNLPDSISFQHLANHTSGLPRMPDNFDLQNTDFHLTWKAYDEAMLIAYLKGSVALNSLPGIAMEYSNLGFGLLGYVIEKITKTSYENLLQSNICDPFLMESTTTKLSNTSKLIRGRTSSGELAPNWEFDVLVGAGGIYSNLDDMLKFAVAHFNYTTPELSLVQQPTMTVDKKNYVALGWFGVNDRTKVLWHNGGTAGYRSIIALDSENRNGVVILTNVSAFHKKNEKIDELCRFLLKSL